MNDAYMDSTIYMVPFLGDLQQHPAAGDVYVLREEVGSAQGKDYVVTCQDMGVGSIKCTDLAGQEIAVCKIPAGEDPYGPWLMDQVRGKTRAGAHLRLVKTDGDIFANSEVKANLVSFDFWKELGRDFRLGRREAQRQPIAGSWKTMSSAEAKLPRPPNGILAVSATLEEAKAKAQLAVRLRLGREPEKGELTVRDWTNPPDDPEFQKKFRENMAPLNWFKKSFLEKAVLRYELSSAWSFAVEISKHQMQ
eukprot:TRINITY_DN31559_c0_g2_i1.p1 TRINITY_DN31559_c0_g2~~TRINITY_DN31559_c0_g2_i1.p1  ORF type:complete len:250 (+),score=54.21 TRINITY_DN31559_c0_g2_i1:1-750(+)